MDSLFFDIVGRFYLFLRYRTAEKRQNILRTEYDGSYELIATTKTLQLFAIALLIIILAMLTALLFGTLF